VLPPAPAITVPAAPAPLLPDELVDVPGAPELLVPHATGPMSAIKGSNEKR
jgi:hypothetical protein